MRTLAALTAVCIVAGIGMAAAQRPRGVVRSQLVWVDRTGRKLSVVGELADMGNLELSPDNKQVAVAVLNDITGTRDLWLYDIATGGRTRLDSNVADENWLIWSPDGGRVAFNSQRTRGLDLYQTSPRGSERQDLLVADDDGKWPVSWSADGKYILLCHEQPGHGERHLGAATRRRPKTVSVPEDGVAGKLGGVLPEREMGGLQFDGVRAGRGGMSRRSRRPRRNGSFRATADFRRGGGVTARNCSSCRRTASSWPPTSPATAATSR